MKYEDIGFLIIAVMMISVMGMLFYFNHEETMMVLLLTGRYK